MFEDAITLSFWQEENEIALGKILIRSKI